jgi:hypothetical protein
MKKNHAAANSTSSASTTIHSGVPRRLNSISAMRSSLARAAGAPSRSSSVRRACVAPRARVRTNPSRALRAAQAGMPA